MKYYTIYKTTNLINNKIYIGAHETNNILDDYLGSGKLVKRAFMKYGIENFNKEVLHVFESEEEMYSKEAELVTEEFVADESNYNIMPGGYGGFSYCNSKESRSTRNHSNSVYQGGYATKRLFEDEKTRYQMKQIVEPNRIKAIKALRDRYSSSGIWTFNGKNHTEDTKTKMSKTHELNHHQQGSKNSQFGTKWIYSEIEGIAKKIDKDELDFWLSNGWILGRKPKNK